MDIIALFLDHPITVFVATITVLGYFLVVRREKSAPGPTYLPFLGIIPGLVGDVTGPLVTKWAKEANSNILCLKIVGVKIAVVSSYELIKETFVKRADFTDRETSNLPRVLEPDYDGIIMSSGEIWRDSRRVTLRRMRDLGMGTSSGQQYIIEEAEILMKTYEEFNGKAMNPKQLINQAVANVINGFAFGKRFDYEDPKFKHVLECVNLLTAEGVGPVGQFVLPFRIGRWLYKERMRLLVTWFDGITEFVDKQITEHQKSFDGTVNDLTDAFLADVREGSGKFTFRQIRCNIMDMFNAGAGTTTIQLQWLLLHMAKYPDVQKKVYQEIQENIGNKVPSMNDKKNTPFTEATINEMMRMNTLLFTGIPRTNYSEDFEIGGYQFKKGTPVIANYWSVHNDPEIFPNPKKFDPGHFLTQDGKVTNLDRMVSFTVGRRSCAGEGLARMEIYLFFVMFVQKFLIRAPEGTEVDLTPNTNFGIYEPGEFQIRLIPRAGRID